MRKKRLIYTLIFDNGNFMLSRNFRLQKVGDYNWINTHYNFEKIAFSIDELIILNVTRGAKNKKLFIETIQQVIKNVFVPIAIGGGITTVSDADDMFLSGADKIVVNTALENSPELIKLLVKKYGAQAVIASIDFKTINGELKSFNQNGVHLIDMNFIDYIRYIQDLGVGEVYLNSIQKDGTGQGYDMETIYSYLDSFNIPVIMAGGAGNINHFLEVINNPHIEAVATANLFNFMGNALPDARKKLLENDVLLARFKAL
ncbi:imidazole glycerol phosphate synthase subunit HisF [Spirochaetia bacterium]|nr:imidazole glycerol phosphate synthase subunit HisF [Spirochaetia bacterium]